MINFLVQEIESGKFVAVDADGCFCLERLIRLATRFSSGEEASLAGLEVCPDGFYLFKFGSPCDGL